ncbi:PilZ domain-containing protein [Anoxybacillus rupiensis]|uniref:PilZ domain-containing protein n=1 Tax=Anoxybacteroides rupiense TaxID=311460 RepID=A0ABD5IX56_9BACL|nr:PilZ domain-containing protein [Anoxybacillus rupiensis]
MEIMISGIFVCLFLLIFSLILFHAFYKQQLRKKEEQIHTLKESVTDLQIKLKDKEKRKAFRVKLFEQECHFELLESGNQPLGNLKNKKGAGQINDISRTGLQISCTLDLPVRKQIFLQIYFVIDGEPFSLKGRIVRKEELINHVIYGIEFVDLHQRDQQKLHRLIQRLEIERRKNAE